MVEGPALTGGFPRVTPFPLKGVSPKRGEKTNQTDVKAFLANYGTNELHLVQV